MSNQNPKTNNSSLEDRPSRPVRPSFREAFRRAASQVELYECTEITERDHIRELCYRAFGTYNLGESTEDENKLIIRGTPVVFDTPTCLYEYDGIKFFEKIARGAFDSADMSDFIFNLNHELTPYARNKNGSLNYSVGDTFDIEAILDGTDERHRQLYGDIKAGRIDKMSFSFTIAESSYDEETRTRTIIRVKKLYDVSAVTFPAYEQTSISARSFFEAERQKETEFLERERRRKELLVKTLL